MPYFDDPDHVTAYIKMVEGYDGRELVEALRGYLPQNSQVLEIGMGPGTDLDLLKPHYQVTGSDFSKVFIERYQTSHPKADLLLLDAVTLKTDRTWEGIYSNKVLHHLQEEELVASLARQSEIIQPGGILMHSFWLGEGCELMEDLLFTYYCESRLKELFAVHFKVLECRVYKEMEKDDSILVVAEAI